MTENMIFWEKLEKTDTKYTKRMTTGAKLTAINPEYQIKRFTEIFGPCGIGWGYRILESFFVEGAEMLHRDHRDEMGQPKSYGPSKVHTLRLELWYIEGRDTYTIQATGHTPFIYLNQYGVNTDYDYEKKSTTDALGRCFAMLGMGADVRMGLFDNKAYIEQLEREQAIDQAVDMEAELIRQRQEFDEWYEKTLKLVETATSMNELEHIFVPAKKRLQGERNAGDRMKTLEDAKNMRGRALIAEERQSKEEAEA